MRAVIEGIGGAVPPKVMTNADLEALVETSDDWIVQRTGIKERRITTADETSATLGATAAKEALENAKLSPKDLELVICATVTGDMMFPSTSCIIQEAIGAKKAGAFDIGAACAGFIYGTAVADSMIRSGQFKNVLVVGVDTLSKFVDWKDRATCVLFGDGAGAVVMSAREDTDRGFLETVLASDGSGAKHINVAAGGSKYPPSLKRTDIQDTIFMAGSEVYRFAVIAMGDACCRVLDKAGLTPEDIDLFVPHQANLRIIDSAAKRLNLPDRKVFTNVHKYGNTSGGSVPLALYEAQKEGRLKEGMLVLTVGFGAGLVWGANVIRW